MSLYSCAGKRSYGPTLWRHGDVSHVRQIHEKFWCYGGEWVFRTHYISMWEERTQNRQHQSTRAQQTTERQQNHSAISTKQNVNNNHTAAEGVRTGQRQQTLAARPL